MNILGGVPGAEPVGAVALLERGDPAELERFRALEDRVWDATTLPATVIEAIRVRCARIRGCAFCASVRMSGATEAGLTEQQLADQDSVERRALLPEDQRAALRLVDAFLLEAATPSAAERRWLVEVLGAPGVVEVLIACAVFASADLRIALGDNSPANSPSVARSHTRRAPEVPTTVWPMLPDTILLPGGVIPHVDARIDGSLRGLREGLLTQAEVSDRLLATCIIRSAQLLGGEDDPASVTLLVPEPLRAGVTPDEVRDWTVRLHDADRAVVAFAEQLWIDPSGLDATLVEPLRSALGDAALIRLTWRLIWIGQLQRMSLVLGPEGTA